MTTAEPPVDKGRPLDHRDATYYVIPTRRRRTFGALMWTVVALLGGVSATWLFKHETLQYALSNDLNKAPQVEEATKILAPEPKSLPDRPWNILVIGSDRRPKDGGDRGRGDTIILVRLDFKQNLVSMLSFPRDLYVEIPGYGRNKINAAYSLGTEKLVIQTVERLTGERVNHFFNVDFNAFRRLVNDAGGVYLDIDRWYFNDNKGRGPTSSFEQLDIKPGYQRLGGFDALDYVRYRKGDNDFGRIARQQAFLAELKRQTNGVKGVNNVLDAVKDEVTTSLKSGSRLEDFLRFGLNTDRIARVTVKTNDQYDVEGVGNVVATNQFLIREAVDQWKNPTFQNDETVPKTNPAKTIVWVYNGSKRLGVGSEATKALEAKGYQAFFAGDAPDGFYTSTAVFYANGKRNAAKGIQTLIGGNASIAQRRNGQERDADVLVMIGGDYDGLQGTKKPAPAAKPTPETVTTTSLRATVASARRLTGMNLLVPTHLPPGSSIRYVRLYNVERGDRGTRNALTFVVQLSGLSKLGGNRYMTITQTSMKDPPIVKTGTCCDKSGNITFYNGKNMQRLLWRKGNMTYWISNSLDESVNAETIRDIKQFMLPPGKAKLKKGERDTAIPVTETSRTP